MYFTWSVSRGLKLIGRDSFIFEMISIPVLLTYVVTFYTSNILSGLWTDIFVDKDEIILLAYKHFLYIFLSFC